MKKLTITTISVLMVALLMQTSALAAITVYDNDQAGWEAAVGTWRTEDFDDTTLNPELSVVSDFGLILEDYGYWWDALYYDLINGVPSSFTTWTFAVPIYAFGGTWDLGSFFDDGEGHVVGGPGSNIEVLINGSWVSVGVIDNDYQWVFWGFVSDVPFTKVRLQAYNNEGFVERYLLDNMVYSTFKHYLTGGGQIVAGEDKRKDKNVVSFAGNLVYTQDFLLMGQYQFNFHNVSFDPLDGAIFHSTDVVELQFYKDDGDGPTPPPAYANVAHFVINGKLKTKDDGVFDAKIVAAVADRGEPGKNNDSIRFRLAYDAVVYDSLIDFPSDSSLDFDFGGGPETIDTKFLAAGNLQIHSE